jgi:hypothetical protein
MCIFEIGLTTNNQQLKASDCYKLSLLEESLSKITNTIFFPAPQWQ